MEPTLQANSTDYDRDVVERTISPTSDDTAPLLGEHAQNLILCNQTLQRLGIDNTIRLPQICVVGDQSTGKSSLIEAISTIKVPKAKGCCTQCPLAINLSSGEDATSPWKCTVSIEEHYHYDQTTTGVTKQSPFGPWQKNSQMRITKVKTTHDKDEVPNLIRAAQAAVLNPDGDVKRYLSNIAHVNAALQVSKFSPNVIRLDVSERNWPNLSFIDLPGVIANTGKEKDKYLVKLIRNLVQQYASAPRSINMLTLPMTHDIENSQACAIVQELKAEGHTLAVFTKADLADRDQQKQFLERFMGHDHLGFEHGYHFVVMPDDMDQSAARAAEKATFAKEPWFQLDQEHQTRLGVDNLRNYLRGLLFKKTAEALPENLRSIQTRLADVEGELARLPAPPDAVLLPVQLQQSVTNFENEMNALFTGELSRKGVSVRAAWKLATAQFQDFVVRTKPTVRLQSLQEEKRLKIMEAKPRQQSANADGVVELSSGDEGSHQPPVKSEPCTTPPAGPTTFAHRFKLDEIRKINEDSWRPGLPGQIESQALDEMNRRSVANWDTLLHKFMHEASRLLNRQVNEVLEGAFGHHKHLEVFSVVRECVRTSLDNLIDREWRIADEMCRLERERPFTYDAEGLQDKEEKCLRERRTKRNEKRLALINAEPAVSKTNGKQKVKNHEDALGPDPFELELRMSAKNKAYYQVAGIRFVDNICLGIFGRLLPGCAHKLVEALKERLGLGDSDKHAQIIGWMTENPEREAQRSELTQEKNHLEAGLLYIENVLGNKSETVDSGKRRASSGDDEMDYVEGSPPKRTKTVHNEEELSSRQHIR